MKNGPDDAVLLHLLRILDITEPIGTWNKKLWIPDPLYEQRECCAGISRDIRAPLTVRDHCRTLHHVCRLLEVDQTLAYNALEEEHWRVLRRLFPLAQKKMCLVNPCANPTVQDYAPIIVRYACQFAHQFSTEELETVAQWISRYYPKVADVNWDAARAYQALKQH